MKTLILMSTIPSTLFLMSTHPVSMMIMIISQTLLLCLILWMMINMSWFSYIMFLIFLGGIMVLFIYITSLASNEKFEINLQQLASQSILMMTFLTLFIYMSTMQLIKNTKMEFSEMIFKIYSFLLMNMTLFSIFYLIFTLIVVVKLTSLLEGPLRAK